MKPGINSIEPWSLTFTSDMSVFRNLFRCSLALLHSAWYYCTGVNGSNISTLHSLYKSAICTFDDIGLHHWTSGPLSIDDFHYTSVHAWSRDRVGDYEHEQHRGSSGAYSPESGKKQPWDDNQNYTDRS